MHEPGHQLCEADGRLSLSNSIAQRGHQWLNRSPLGEYLFTSADRRLFVQVKNAIARFVDDQTILRCVIGNGTLRESGNGGQGVNTQRPRYGCGVRDHQARIGLRGGVADKDLANVVCHATSAGAVAGHSRAADTNKVSS